MKEFRCYKCYRKFEAAPKHDDHAYDITCPHCGWFKQAYKFYGGYEDCIEVETEKLDEIFSELGAINGLKEQYRQRAEKAEAKRDEANGVWNKMLQFALELDSCEVKDFLTLWNEGAFPEIARCWPNWDMEQE